MRRVFYGWIVVAASATIVCVALGCLFALGVFLAPIERAMGWSRGAISTVALLNWIAMGLGSFFWGALSDRIGGRGVAVGGGFLLGLGLVLASQAQALWQFSLSFGFLVGFAAGAFAAPQFWAIALTHFACCAAHSGPIFHMVTHATDQGVAAMAAATVFGVSGLASIVGRIGGGLLADRFGAKPTLIAGLAVQAAMIFGYLFARDLGSFVALALVFGTAYGGVMPLYALVTREYFGEKVMGSAYGAVFLISTLGMGLGSFAGGVIYDRLGSYVWLFLASFAIGTMAVVLAFTFRRPRRPALALTEAAAAR